LLSWRWGVRHFSKKNEPDISIQTNFQPRIDQADPVDGTFFQEGESVYVCKNCSTPYRSASIDFLVEQGKKLCVNCPSKIKKSEMFLLPVLSNNGSQTDKNQEIQWKEE
jgi:hypothetical protein